MSGTSENPAGNPVHPGQRGPWPNQTAIGTASSTTPHAFRMRNRTTASVMLAPRGCDVGS
jgi:hypothetical protein